MRIRIFRTFSEAISYCRENASIDFPGSKVVEWKSKKFNSFSTVGWIIKRKNQILREDGTME